VNWFIWLLESDSWTWLLLVRSNCRTKSWKHEETRLPKSRCTPCFTRVSHSLSTLHQLSVMPNAVHCDLQPTSSIRPVHRQHVLSGTEQWVNSSEPVHCTQKWLSSLSSNQKSVNLLILATDYIILHRKSSVRTQKNETKDCQSMPVFTSLELCILFDDISCLSVRWWHWQIVQHRLLCISLTSSRYVGKLHCGA